KNSLQPDRVGRGFFRAHQHRNPFHLFALLRTRHHRPRRRAAEPHDEHAPFHSMTSSARRSNVSGITSPSFLAVLRLITKLNFVGWSIGSSLGFSPLRMRPT